MRHETRFVAVPCTSTH